MKSILITGGSGLIGKQLKNILLTNNYQILILTRYPEKISKQEGITVIKWDIKKNIIDSEKLKSVCGIVHLSGANIGKGKWTKKRKRDIYDSRILSTRFLYETIKQNNTTLDFFISASAIGYYGTLTSNKEFSESSPNGNDFLASLCQDWEIEAQKFNSISKRVVILRTGVVFSKIGGALPKIILPIKYFLGGPIGSGNQIVPWIHIDDISRMYQFAIENNLRGIYNAVVTSEEQPTNKLLGQEIANTIKRPYVFPKIPGFIFKLFFGEMACILLEGTKINNDKIIDSKFKFNLPNLKLSLKDILLKSS